MTENDYFKLKDIKFYQLNLNAVEKDINTKERQIMRCDVLTNTVFDTNEVIFLKYLEKIKNRTLVN